MKKIISPLLMLLMLASVVVAQEEKAAEKKADQAKPKADDSELEKSIRDKPDDLNLLNKYMGQKLNKVMSQMDAKPDSALKVLDEMDLFLGSVEPTEAKAKQLLMTAKRYVGMYRERVELSKTTIDELKERLNDSPNAKTISMLIAKTSNEAGRIARDKPDDAEKIVNKTKEILKGVRKKTEKESLQKSIDMHLERSFLRLERTIEGGKKLLALIGKDAAELKIEDWANGDALTNDDLKGKVVLLDFWAVWCGPCIATFPHLREWQEKYSEKGLVIIGLTRYYDYEWDSEAGRAKRSKEKVKPEDEREMLKHFAEHHKLEHRFAIQPDSKLSEFYAVSGIPHVVLIDQKGKIRLIKVGSGPQNAAAIDALLEELLPSKP